MQVLIYPALQAIDLQLPSYLDDSSALLSRQRMVSFWLFYAVGDDEANAQLQINNHTTSYTKRKYVDVINRNYLPKDISEGHDEAGMHDGNHALWGRFGRMFEDPYFSPGVASDLRDLPMTHILTMGSDPLRDEGIIYAERLRKTGNKVKHDHYASGFHGIFMFPFFEDCLTARQGVVRYLGNNL